MNRINSDSIIWPITGFAILLALALYTIGIYDYLFHWDERFHALVAKNLLSDPTFPKLYPKMPLEVFDNTVWYRSEAWLHKPPLFSYQMAFWMHLLGSSIWAMRFNSAVMLIVFSAALYKIARLRNVKRMWAVLAVSAFSFSPMFFSLISGRMGMDHNDVSFLGHIALSFYFLEYFLQKGEKFSAVLIGVFCAAAVLTKWLPGLLVFLTFGLRGLQVSFQRERFSKNLWFGFIVAFLVCFLLVGSWNLYSFLKFPSEWTAALKYNGRHFSEALEGHRQPLLFHLKVWLTYFSIPLIAAGLALRRKNLKKNWPHLVSFFFVLLFFSLANTKLPAYTIIGLVPLFVFSLAFYKQEKLLWKRVAIGLSLIALMLSGLQIVNLYKRSLKDPAREVAQFYQNLAENLEQKAILFNLPAFQYPQAMFYTDKLAFDILPEVKNLEELKKEGYVVYILKHVDKPFDRKKYRSFQTIEYAP